MPQRHGTVRDPQVDRPLVGTYGSMPRTVVLPIGADADAPAAFTSATKVPATLLRHHLSTVRGFVPRAQRDEHLRRARLLSNTLTAACSDSEGISEGLDAQSPVQTYFRIRTGILPPDAEIAQTSRLIEAVLEEMLDAPLAGSDFERLSAGLVAVLRDHGAEATAASVGPHTAGEPSNDDSDEERWMRRWIIAHQAHAVLNVGAARAIRRGTKAARADDLSASATHLVHACSFVQAFAPARALALALPPAFYNDVLRPTMTPPLTKKPLSGRMHGEYRSYREEMTELLSAIPSPIAELSPRAPGLALARERLLEADLIDAERHVSLVEPMVGPSKSIVQTARSPLNALSVLRSIRAGRSATIAPFTRFPTQDLLRGIKSG